MKTVLILVVLALAMAGCKKKDASIMEGYKAPVQGAVSSAKVVAPVKK